MDEINLNGALASPYDARDYRLNADVVASCVFPTEFKLDLPFLKNQGTTGACVAFALSEIMEYHLSKQTLKEVEMSTGCIYGNREPTDFQGQGMIIREALKNANHYGNITNLQFPEIKEVPEIIDLFKSRCNNLREEAYQHRITAYFKLETTEEIKYALMNYGPVIFSIRWYSDLKVTNGIIQSAREDYAGAHCMVIYGWDEKGWLIQNSWGAAWGRVGRAILPYDYPLKEAWCIADDFNEGSIYIPFKSKYGQTIAKCINFVIRLWNLFTNWVKEL